MIESHLAQTYRKLGVRDRNELSELLAGADPDLRPVGRSK
jgi:hypothetical protein